MGLGFGCLVKHPMFSGNGGESHGEENGQLHGNWPDAGVCGDHTGNYLKMLHLKP